jgi:hypothetical protein
MFSNHRRQMGKIFLVNSFANFRFESKCSKIIDKCNKNSSTETHKMSNEPSFNNTIHGSFTESGWMNQKKNPLTNLISRKMSQETWKLFSLQLFFFGESEKSIIFWLSTSSVEKFYELKENFCDYTLINISLIPSP